MDRRLYRKGLVLFAAVAVLLALPVAYLHTDDRTPLPQDPLAVVERYLRAVYARDYKEAYRDISSADRRVKDVNRYVRERGPFNGFALEAAKKLAESIQITATKKDMTTDRAELTVRMKVPDAERLSALLLSWDPYQLNSLSDGRRNHIIESLNTLQREKSLSMIEGEQAFDLVREHDTWKIFLNWAAGVKVAFKTSLAGTSGLEATLPQNEVITQTGELFNVVLKIRNRSDQDVFTRIGHLIEPQDVGDHLDLVECGFLVPVRIPSGTEVEYLSTYLLRASIPESLRQVRVTYAFKVEK